MKTDAPAPEIFFFEAFEEEEAALRHYLPPGWRVGFSWKTIQEYGGESPPAPVISIRTQSTLPANWMPALAGLLTRSTGYDHVRRWREEGLACPAGFLPQYCADAVAEQALLLWLALLRRLPRQVAQFARFERDGLTGRECRGKTLTVFGVGQIGRATLRLGAALGMRTLGVDPVQGAPDCTYVPPEAGMAQADVAVCAMNLTPQNTGYFSEDTLACLKPGAVLVNIARGELTPPIPLRAALERGALAGVALDVFPHESRLAVALRAGAAGDDDPERAALLALRAHPNVILTPHNAFNTHESVDRKSSQSIDQLNALRQSGRFLWPVP